METTLPNQYRDYLQDKKKISKATVKNYLADIRRFISWYENISKGHFTPSAVDRNLASEYLSGNYQATVSSETPSASSLKRYSSSLRKFYDYLVETGVCRENPFEANMKQNSVAADPWHIKEFKNYLFLSNVSKVTLKNYLIDVRQFTDWAQQVLIGTEKPAEASVLNAVDTSLVKEYKNRLLTEVSLSPVSINRKLSSLRKYFGWAHQQQFMQAGITITNENTVADRESMPNQTIMPVIEQSETKPLELTALKEIAAKDEKVVESSSYSRFPPLRFIQKTSRFGGYIISSAVLLPIDKMAELASYSYWKASGRKVFAPIEEVIGTAAATTITEANKQLQGNNSGIIQAKAAVFAGKQIMKSANIISHISAKIGTNNRRNTVRIQGFPKSFYAPLTISTQNLPLRKKFWHHVRHSRPAWYHRYHAYRITHYIHIGILLAATTMIGLHVYMTLAKQTEAQIAVVASPSATSPPRTLSFQGKLNDATNTPITAETKLRFAIYKSDIATGAAQLWQEVQTVKPDHEGNFSVLLGKKNTLHQNVFTDYPSLFLGISVGNDKELKPRHPLSNVTNATNARTIQGLKPITDLNAGTKNVILALDSSGNLTIGGSASPVIQASGGELTLSGQVLTLTTVPGSNSNVQIKPDGNGIIDLQKPIQNTSEYISIPSAQGAVAIEDIVAINATSSGQSALTINQNSTGPLISASTAGVAKFTLDHQGNGFFGGNISLSGNKLTSSAYSFDLINTNAININFGGSATALSIGSSNGSTSINNNLKVRGTTTLNGPVTTTELLTVAGGITIPKGKSVTLTDYAAGSLLFVNNNNQIASDSGNLFWDSTNKRLGIGTNTPGSNLSIANLTTGTGTAMVIDSNGNVFKNSSSKRYKDDIKTFHNNPLLLLNASPVTFRYKDSGMYDFGFIAEDLDALGLKDLVVYDKEGRPDAVKYDKMSIYILEIVKQQQTAIKALKETITTIEDGYAEVAQITSEGFKVVTEDISIDGQSLKEYVTGIVSDSTKQNTEMNQTIVASPIATGSAEIAFEPEQTLVEPTATESALLTNSDASSAAMMVSDINNTYSNVSPSASMTGILQPFQAKSALFQPGNVMNIKYEGSNTNYANIASFSADLAYVPNFKSNYATFHEGLIALGPTSLTDVAVSGRLSLGGNLHISENAINTIATDLELQPLRQGNLSIMGGMVVIDTEGNLNVNGSANFAKDVTVKGKLAAGLIAPVPQQDLIIGLPNKDEGKGASLIVQNATGSGVLEINQKGDVVASGEGRFERIASKDFKIIRGVQADTSLVETVAEGSAGTGVITAYETERTIRTPYVTKDSLIYVTATSNTGKVSPYIARQTEDSFTVQIPSRVTQDVKFNWWIVN